MNGYNPSKPSAALGLIAVAMSAITIGAMVVLPVKLDSVNAEPSMLAAAEAATKAPIEVAVDPQCDDVPAVVDRDVHAGRRFSESGNSRKASQIEFRAAGQYLTHTNEPKY